EREMFIEAFWRKRDPNPHTPENEFKTEHFRRIKYANNWFGRESPVPGWKTDMGRIYIILGEPKTIERFENLSEVRPTIIWFYEGFQEYGLPNAFNVVFFKRSGVGEYELYSPVKFGPQGLLNNYRGDPLDSMAAYYELRNAEPNIAKVSLTLLEGEERHTFSPSIASEILISEKIPKASYQKVDDAYAEKLLQYKDFVEVDYTANYIDNDSYVRVIKDSSGIFFVHFLIEPSKLSIEQLQNEFYTNININGKVSDIDGNTIFQYEKTVPIKFNKDQLANIKNKLFSFQDMFPLIEGNYKFDLLLKNTVSKEFTSFEKSLTIPETSSFQMSPRILANRIIRDSKYKGNNKPFLLNDIQLVPSPRSDFVPQDILYLYFQIYGMKTDMRENGYLEYAFFKENDRDKPVLTKRKSLKDYPGPEHLLEEFPLTDFSPGHYLIKVSLFDNREDIVIFEQSFFSISPFSSMPRPWVLSFPMPPSNHPMYSNIIGNQLLNKKHLSEAKALLGKAYHQEPLNVKFALDFSHILYLIKDYRGVKETAEKFLDHQEKHRFLELLGKSCQKLGEFQQAISYYKEYLSHYGTNLNILNSVGECYYNLGNKKEALVAWEKSLEINPNQENIKKVVESIKEK
ncbi:MAG: GWxTD domain-containing protein, partial [Acidobacteriota bacterium]